uniref:F-box/kelch-repeat protein SKIP4 n=1 Tax=Anthurium amnicola TaxID=1678845 RepID=A0A1D1Y968_9ARAE
MASVSSALGKSGQIDELYSPLINGLPDDIALLCLARIPRRYHNILRCVSKRWKALLYSEEWLCCRQKQDLQETWIYAICRHNKRRNCYYVFDPSSARRHWTCLQGVPPQCLKRDGMAFETVGSKLYILGGCTWGEDATDDVYFYDASMNAWAKSTPMPTARCYFATAVLGDRLYATDGAGMDSTLFQSWDTYESHSDHWIPSRAQKVAAGIQKSIALDGKIYTIHEDSNEFHYAGVFDPSDNEWEHLNSEIALCWRGPTVVIDGTLFMLDETSGVKLMRWQRQAFNTAG